MTTQLRIGAWFFALLLALTALTGLVGMQGAEAAAPSHARGAGPTQAGPPDHAQSPVASTTDADPAEVADYWTPERRDEALPGDVRLTDQRASGGPVDTGPPVTVGPTEPAHHRPDHAGGPPAGRGGPPDHGGRGGPPDHAGPPDRGDRDDDEDGEDEGDDEGDDHTVTVTGDTWDAGGQVADTTGKVFFTLDGVDYVCSGSSVTADNDSLVLTAGHCVHEGAGGDNVDNWAFVPAYSGSGTDQVGDHGVWTATDLYTTTDWAQDGDLTYDVGFAVVTGGDDERSLAEVVGAQGIGLNQSTGVGHHVYAFGYPHAPPYDGTTLSYCAGDTVADTGGLTTQGLHCDLTGGSSGGPWYADFDPDAGQGTAVSVTSYRYTSGGNTDNVYGPFFGAEVAAVYEAAQG